MIMATRMRHLRKALRLKPGVHLADNGTPLPVAVGILRSATLWTVLFMWEQGRNACWIRIVSGEDTGTPAGFMQYTTFMWRLSCYARLFSDAIVQVLAEVSSLSIYQELLTNQVWISMLKLEPLPEESEGDATTREGSNSNSNSNSDSGEDKGDTDMSKDDDEHSDKDDTTYSGSGDEQEYSTMGHFTSVKVLRIVRGPFR
jgi:hypothetical protein